MRKITFELDSLRNREGLFANRLKSRRTVQIESSVHSSSIKTVTGVAMEVARGDRMSGDGRRWSPESDGAPARSPELLQFRRVLPEVVGVSQYTGRIHLHSCIPGIDSRPRLLFENFKPLDLESPNLPDKDSKSVSKSIKDNPEYRPALLAFIEEWKNLRPVQRNKLLAKPLQLPLSVELCCLTESLNHDSGGLLKGKSKRRTTPLNEISHVLPPNAEWKRVHLPVGHCQKEKEYTQGWTVTGEPLCKLCQTPCKGENAETPEFLEDLFCNLSCYEEYRFRTSNRFIRQELFQIERGICTNCQLDCHKLVEHLKPLSNAKRQKYIEKVAPKLARRECRLENMRTLCVVCHADVTSLQCAERRLARIKAKKQLKAIMNGLRNIKEAEQSGSNLKDHDHMENIVDDELLIEVPGSAYSGAGNGVTRTEKH
ncbi:hypothetical protein C3L33_00887, partial [Rhododendron williamsianum]